MQNKKNKIYIIFLCIILILISFLIDEKIIQIIEIIKSPLLDILTNWVTSFFTVFVILILITTLFLWEEKKREYIPILWLSFFTAIIISFSLKFIIAKPRPSIELFYPLIHSLNYSFPSIHTIVAFAVLPILDKEFPMFKWFWIGFVVLVAFSRIYTGAHYLSDVIFGASIGYFIGLFFIFIEEKYKIFKKYRIFKK